MKSLLLAITCVLLFACEKETPETVNGVVIDDGGPGYLVEIEMPNSSKHRFICSNAPMPAIPGQYNCTNAVFIVNLPAFARVAGTKIAFSRYKNLGPNPIWSATYVPNDVEAYDVSKRQ